MKILLVSKSQKPRRDLPFDPDIVVWPVEVSPDSSLLPKSSGHVFTASNTLGDQKQVQRRSYEIAHDLWTGTTEFRGLCLIWAIEDALANMIQTAVAQEVFFERLRPLFTGKDQAYIQAYSGSDLKTLIRRLSESGCLIHQMGSNRGGQERYSRWTRRFDRIKEDSKGGLKNLSISFLERLDRSFRIRPRLGKSIFPIVAEKGFHNSKKLAFSSTEVFSRTLLDYKKELGHLCFVVAGKAAAAPLIEKGIPFKYWWEFARGLRFPEKEIRLHVEELLHQIDEKEGGRFLRESGNLKQLEHMILPFLARLTILIQRILDDLNPKQIVVANQGSAHEAVILHEASRRRFPSLQLQHGVMGADYFEYQPLRSEKIWVKGPFWRDFLPPESREKAFVVGKNGATVCSSQRVDADAVVFLTAPFEDFPFRNVVEAKEIVLKAYDFARGLGRFFIIRVHPRDRKEAYIKWLGSPSSKYHEINQGGSIHPVLRRARMVVTYFSTVFMDCLQLGVPLISFDWHPFRFKPKLQNQPVFLFARSFAHLKELMETVDRDREKYGEQVRRTYHWFSQSVS